MTETKNTKDDSSLMWKQGASKILLHTPVFDVTSVPSVSAQGVSGDYVVLNGPDWVIVVPDAGKDFLMVKQWRHGENALSIEFPGGVMDKGETPEQAAARELKEETGCSAGKLIHLRTMNPNPAVMSNHVHFFLAQDLSSAGDQQLDEDEFISCFAMSKDEVGQKMGSKEFPHAIMASALMFYWQYERYHK